VCFSEENSVHLTLELISVRGKMYGLNILLVSFSLTVFPDLTSFKKFFLLKNCINVKNKLTVYELQYNKLQVKAPVLIIVWWNISRL